MGILRLADKLKIGDICLVENNSVDSLVFWKQMSRRFPYLLCPCSIKSTTRLVVAELLGSSSVLVQLQSDPKKLSVFRNKDLKIVH